jgi:hypothetical protein
MELGSHASTDVSFSLARDYVYGECGNAQFSTTQIAVCAATGG